jgi:hypothetical protein
MSPKLKLLSSRRWGMLKHFKSTSDLLPEHSAGKFALLISKEIACHLQTIPRRPSPYRRVFAELKSLCGWCFQHPDILALYMDGAMNKFF